MNYKVNVQNMKSSLAKISKNKESITHSTKIMKVLPFPTREPERVKFEKGFIPIIGEIMRIVQGKKLDKKLTKEYVIQLLEDKVEVEEEDRPYFREVIKELLFDEEGDIKTKDLKMLNLQNLSSNKQHIGEIQIAQFFKDVFMQQIDELKEKIQQKESKDLLIKLINGEQLLEDYRYPITYTNHYEEITKLWEEDMTYLLKYKDYLEEQIELFFAYYYFLYVTQLTLNYNLKEKADYTKLTPFYYILEDEGSSKKRLNYYMGYDKVKSAAVELRTHLLTQEYLNNIAGNERPAHYVELKNQFLTLQQNEQQEFIEAIEAWNSYYTSKMLIENRIEEIKGYDESVEKLFASLKKGISVETKSRQALNIESIGKKYFLRRRGSLGYILVCSSQLLLLLTVLAVKDKKITLAQLFKELERRGMFFDNISKELIIDLYSQLNLIERKSDSGDAQYINPIL